MRSALSVWTIRSGIALAAFLGLTFSHLRAQELLPNIPTRKLNLQECIALGMESQPALAAARASLSAAHSAQSGLNSIKLGRMLSPDLPIRKQQGCLGIQIAEAGLAQAEWETRYAVTRNYCSVAYARMQSEVVKGLVDKLDGAAKKVKSLVDAGDPKIPLNMLDHDNLIINRDFYKAREYEATIGIDKAMAALREAIGVRCDYPLDIVAAKLPPPAEVPAKEELIAIALSQRSEMAQVSAAHRVTELEIQAQARIRSPTARTFAIGSDIHAKPVPQGVANTEYRPWAIGLEMPVNMAGHRRYRIARASDLNDRAGSVVDKTEGLITLEVEAAYLKWKEAASKAKTLAGSITLAQKVADNTRGRLDFGKATGEEVIRSQTQQDQVRVAYNDALYFHALALAALERITAGGYSFPQSLPKP